MDTKVLINSRILKFPLNNRTDKIFSAQPKINLQSLKRTPDSLKQRLKALERKRSLGAPVILLAYSFFPASLTLWYFFRHSSPIEWISSCLFSVLDKDGLHFLYTIVRSSEYSCMYYPSRLLPSLFSSSLSIFLDNHQIQLRSCCCYFLPEEPWPTASL